MSGSIVEKETFLIRSTDSPYELSLPIRDLDNLTHIVVSSASIPKTFYVIPALCSFEVSENDVVHYVDVEAGNYSVRSLRSILETAINASTVAWTYTITYPTASTSADTGKYTFGVSGNSGVQPEIRTTDANLARCCGLVVDEWYAFSGDTLESANVVNFVSNDEIFLKCDLVKSKNNILQEIYSSGEIYNSSITFQCSDLMLSSKKLKDNYSSTVKFWLENGDGESINFNGNAWSAVITLYRQSNLESVIRKFIDFNLHLQRKEEVKQELEEL